MALTSILIIWYNTHNSAYVKGPTQSRSSFKFSIGRHRDYRYYIAIDAKNHMCDIAYESLYFQNKIQLHNTRRYSRWHFFISEGIYTRADSRLAPSRWEPSLQSNAVSHWLGAILDSALYTIGQIFDRFCNLVCFVEISKILIEWNQWLGSYTNILFPK